MSNLKKQYNEVMSQKSETQKRIEELKKNSFIKEYFELCKKEADLSEKEEELYTEIKIEEYKSCNHLCILTDRIYDGHESRGFNMYGCIKCGLNQKIIGDVNEGIKEYSFLTPEEKIMYRFSEALSAEKFKKTVISCDFDTAKRLYSKVKENHPNIDDETVIKYIELELNSIENEKQKGKSKVICKN